MTQISHTRSRTRSQQWFERAQQSLATPGGIAATVMASLDDAGYARIITEGLRAGARQARKNARQ